MEKKPSELDEKSDSRLIERLGWEQKNFEENLLELAEEYSRRSTLWKTLVLGLCLNTSTILRSREDIWLVILRYIRICSDPIFCTSSEWNNFYHVCPFVSISTFHFISHNIHKEYYRLIFVIFVNWTNEKKK